MGCGFCSSCAQNLFVECTFPKAKDPDCPGLKIKIKSKKDDIWQQPNDN